MSILDALRAYMDALSALEAASGYAARRLQGFRNL